MYTIKQAAARSGVNVSLLRAWERRYGIVSPARTDSGYRLYDDDAIERLRAMRSLVTAGWSAKQAAERIATANIGELGEMARATPRPAEEPEDPSAAFVDGAARLDTVAIEHALDDIFAAGSFERVVEDRLFPALRALGDAWASGAVDVAGEHAASAAVTRRLSMAFEASGTNRSTRPPVLVGLPPGARHELAALAFATAARRSGLPIIYLGSDVPVQSWIAAVARTGAPAVAFGVVMDHDVAAADEVVRALRDANPEVVVAIGGRGSAVVGNGDILRLPDSLAEAVEGLRQAIG